MSKCKCFYSINLHFEEIIPIELKNESTKIKICYKSCEIEDAVSKLYFSIHSTMFSHLKFMIKF